MSTQEQAPEGNILGYIYQPSIYPMSIDTSNPITTKTTSAKNIL